jgi:hypothetical protein
MQEVDGELLIGGARLAPLHCELDEDQCAGHAHEWKLAGRIRLPSEELQQLELERTYRLQLADGRAGQIVVTHFAKENGNATVAEFHPPHARRAK